MPEGDTVWLTARKLNTVLAGLPLTAAQLRAPQHATEELAGLTVREVVSRGKHLLARFDSDLTLHTHLGMDGAWWLRKAGTRWPSPDEPIRVVLENDRALALGHRLARVDLIRTTSEHTLVGHLGPDLLDPDVDVDEAVRRLSAQPDRTVGEALLDQRNLAGIGNLYRAETLFLRGVHPRTPVRAAGDLPAMVRLARRLLWLNREHPEQATTGELRKGRQHYAYDRTGKPCLRCRTPIRRGELDGRRTYWCPHCQPIGQ